MAGRLYINSKGDGYFVPKMILLRLWLINAVFFNFFRQSSVNLWGLKCGDFIMEKCQKLFRLFIRILHAFFGESLEKNSQFYLILLTLFN